MYTDREKIGTLIKKGYRSLLFVGVLLFIILLFFPIFGITSYNKNAPLLDELYRVIISMLLIIAPLFFLLHRKINLGYQLIKNMLLLFSYSFLLVPFISLCAGPFRAARGAILGITMHFEYYRSNLVPFLTCPSLNAPGYELLVLPVEMLIFLFLISILTLNFIQAIANVYYYIKIRKKTRSLFALGISLLLGTILIGIFIRLFELAGNVLWR